ncbi:MAG TPA: helix-hairpin-helix domain-containing protein [Candidatus Limnocylindria bacterium]|jgi:DNA uptake protein ComE-like DNA-binding protein|nr:helix-hairpin-helix domain-containing protein [Candidatus Limnocylindria bacterium]
MLRVPARLATLVLVVALVGPACDLLHRRHAPAAPAPVDLNRASLRKLEKLPGITPSMARRIVEGRPYEEPHDLVKRGILTERELDRILDRVVVTSRAR